MKKALLACSLIFLSACSCRELYAPALSDWEGNLKRMRPTLVKGLEGAPEELRKSRLGLYDDVINGMARVRGEGPEVWNEESEDEE